MTNEAIAPFRMPEAWHGQVPRQYLGHNPHRHCVRVPAPFNAFDTHMVVNTTTGLAMQSENCPGRASMAATAMSDHNFQHGNPDRYSVVRIPGFLTGKTGPENWQQLLDKHYN